MKIFHNSQPLQSLKRFILRSRGVWFARLTGINLEEDARGIIHVSPVYRPLVRFTRYPGQLFIEIPVFAKMLNISISRRGIEMRMLESGGLMPSDVGNEDA